MIAIPTARVIGRFASTPSSENTVSRRVMVLRISIMISSFSSHVVRIDFSQRAPEKSTIHEISIGPLREARYFAVHLDPRQRVVTKDLPSRLCDGRIVKRPYIQNNGIGSHCRLFGDR